MAAPHVAGTAALILAANSALLVEEVRTILKDTADDLGPAGKDDYYGYGLVDAEESVTGTQTSPKVVASETPRSTKSSTWGQIKSLLK